MPHFLWGMVQIERIGSIEKHGDYRRVHIAVNGYPCVPVWMCEPEFQSYEALGEEGLFNRLAFVSISQTQNELALSGYERELLAAAMATIAQRRNAA